MNKETWERESGELVELVKASFAIDGVEGEFIGYDDGSRWNGFGRPLLTDKVVEQVCAALRAAGGYVDHDWYTCHGSNGERNEVCLTGTRDATVHEDLYDPDGEDTIQSCGAIFRRMEGERLVCFEEFFAFGADYLCWERTGIL